MTGRDFFAKVYRLGAYGGVISARMQPRRAAPSDEVLDGSSVTLQSHPALAGLFEKGGKKV